jgi:hypothetical protein
VISMMHQHLKTSPYLVIISDRKDHGNEGILIGGLQTDSGSTSVQKRTDIKSSSSTIWLVLRLGLVLQTANR